MLPLGRDLKIGVDVNSTREGKTRTKILAIRHGEGEEQGPVYAASDCRAFKSSLRDTIQ